MRVVFSYIGELHQVFHSLPLAAELTLRHPDIEVRIAGATLQHLDFIRRSLDRHAPTAWIEMDLLRPCLLPRIRWRSKRRMLLRNLRYFRSFDAIVTPERSSLFLRRVGLGATKIIWSGHGAGDRAIGFAADICEFDYVLMAGRKIETRLLAGNLIRPGDYTTDVYTKFDWLRQATTERLFDNDRPVVLYNPHFRDELSSWPLLGRAVLEFFVAHPQWNLVFAPHVRLFQRVAAATRRQLESYAAPNVLIDLGSERSIDMTYTRAADLYLGDVSSQAAEFVCRPRPCLFLNAHRVAWQGDPNYLMWKLGPVTETLDDFAAKLQSAFDSHPNFVETQRRYVAETFGSVADGAPSAARGAEAIAAYLERIRKSQSARRGRWRRGVDTVTS